LSARTVATSTTAVGDQPAVAALDVEEFLHADVGAEAGLGEHVALRPDQLERDLVGDDRGVAVGDVGKRPGMDERGRAFQRLHQVGLDGVLHQHGQRARAADVLGGDRVALASSPMTMRPKRSRMSCSEVVSARIAMISLATVMS
jgi:hypothetical protein